MDLVRLGGARGPGAIALGTGGAFLTGCLGRVAFWMAGTVCNGLRGGQGGGEVGLETLFVARLGCFCLVNGFGGGGGGGGGSWTRAGIELRSTISISCGDIWLDWNAVLFWLLFGGVINGSEKLTDRCLGGLLIMLEFLFLPCLFCLTLSTMKAIQQFRRNIIPAPAAINAITLPKERW